MNLLDRMTLRPAQEFVDEYGLGSGGGAPAGFETPPAAAPAVYAPMDVPEDYSWAPEALQPPTVTQDNFGMFYAGAHQNALADLNPAQLFEKGTGFDTYVSRMSSTASAIQFSPGAASAFRDSMLGTIDQAPLSAGQKETYTKQILDSIKVSAAEASVAVPVPTRWEYPGGAGIALPMAGLPSNSFRKPGAPMLSDEFTTPATIPDWTAQAPEEYPDAFVPGSLSRQPFASPPAAPKPTMASGADAAAPSGAASDPYGFEGRALQETPAYGDAMPSVGKTGLLPSFASRLEARRALSFESAKSYESAINDPKVPESVKNTAAQELRNLKMTLSEFETQIAKDNAAAKVGMADNQEALVRAEAALSKLGPDSQERIEAAGYISKAKSALNDPDQVKYTTDALDAANRVLTKENRAFVRFTTANQAAVRASATLDEALKIPGAAAKFGSQAANAKTLYEEAQDPELGYEDRATRMTLARGEIAKVSLDIEAAMQGRKDPSFGGIYRLNLLDQPTSEISGSSVALYLSVFGAIAGPVLAAQESKKNRQFQMDLYNLQRQNAREDLQWQYDLRKAYGEDSASVAAAQASAGKAAAAPVSKADINLSKAKVKVS